MTVFTLLYVCPVEQACHCYKVFFFKVLYNHGDVKFLVMFSTHYILYYNHIVQTYQIAELLQAEDT